MKEIIKNIFGYVTRKCCRFCAEPAFARGLWLSGVGLIVAFSGSCSINPATGGNDLVLMTEDQEIALGRNSHAEIIKHYGVYDDPGLAAYVQKIGERVARHSHRNDLVYRFTVLDSPQVNAFALPGGYIYVTRGILAYLNSEAELAAVLGHEVAHVTARHAVRQHSASAVIGITGAILAAKSDVAHAQELSDIFSTALVRGYGREHELEADRLGTEYLVRAGYRHDAMLDVIRVLKNQELLEKNLARLENRKPGVYHGLFSTHPDNDRRLQSIISASRNLHITGNARDDGRLVYLKKIAGLVFGAPGKEGVLRGNRFYHQDMGFTMAFPEGWRVDNQPDKLTAHAPKNIGSIMLTAIDINQRISPRIFLEKIPGLKNIQRGTPISRHGLQGYTAVARIHTEYGQRMARYIVLYYGNKAFVIVGASKRGGHPGKFDKRVLSVGQSFRPLEKSEYRLARPGYIDVIKYSGQGYSKLAAESPLDHLAESQLRMLNNHYPQGEPALSGLIKIIK